MRDDVPYIDLHHDPGCEENAGKRAERVLEGALGNLAVEVEELLNNKFQLEGKKAEGQYEVGQGRALVARYLPIVLCLR